MQYNVFVDFHHSSLLYSLILLFEKRLGGNVYRPIGLDWFREGYWKINDQLDTAEQFLSPNAGTPDGTPPLNDILGTGPVGAQLLDEQIELYYCKDIHGERANKAVTLSTFYRLPIDLVIASIPQHIEPFRKLCEQHPNKPKLIYQIGNQWNIGDSVVKNIMSSARIDYIPPGINYIEYHQEFDTSIFAPDLPEDWTMMNYPQKNIYSFINIFQHHRDFAIFEEVEHHLQDWTFRSFGGQCRDGNMTGDAALAAKMKEARFIWHTKQHGDGYGHILHNAAAVGRPVITRYADYCGKLGEKLLIPDETCIFIDGLTPEQIVDKIIEFSEPMKYKQMCRNVYWNFKRVVDFNIEEQAIRGFLLDLQ